VPARTGTLPRQPQTMRADHALPLAFLLGAAAPACGPSATFECHDSSDCTDGRDGGVCEGGYCAFVDGDCPTARRWGEHAPEEIAGECVPWDAGGPADLPDLPGESKGALDGDTGDLDDGASELDDGSETTGGDDETPPQEPPEPGWICTSDPMHVIDTAAGTFGGWTPGYTGPAPSWTVASEGLRLRLESSSPSSAFFSREPGEVDEIIVAAGLQLDGADAYGWLEIVTDVPYRIEREGTQLRIVDGQEPDVVSVHEGPPEVGAWDHLRIVLTRDTVGWEASADGVSFERLASRPRVGDTPVTSTAIGLTRETESASSADLLVHAVARCGPA
jgi:hypothetical protein